MIEIICSQLISTLPIHLFAYAPFLNHLRFGKKWTFALVLAMEVTYLSLLAHLLKAGADFSCIPYIAIPLFGILFFLCVEMEPGKIMFLYIFSCAYMMAIRGITYYLELTLFGEHALLFYSWYSGWISFVLFLLTMPAMLWYFKQTAQMVFETNAPQVWRKVWLLPLFNALIVLLFTLSPKSASQINARFLLTRLLLITCMFLIYYFVIHSINQFQQQIEMEEYTHYLKQLTCLQTRQYDLLKSHIEETCKAQHDLRQHLRALQGYIDTGNLSALTSYVKLYRESIPDETRHEYCKNNAIDSVLSYYASKASLAGIQMEISLCPMQESIIPEPEFCVLIGNLLENALEACQLLPPDKLSASPKIIVRAQKTGKHMLSLAVDNTCPKPPVFVKGQILSSKHEGFGIGTESVKSIAEKYHGDARFEWKLGMFYSSVMLNRPD